MLTIDGDKFMTQLVTVQHEVAEYETFGIKSEFIPKLRNLGIDPVTYSAIKETLYSEASDKSVMMVLSYCKARSLDPFLKPLHIVSMPTKDKNDNWTTQEKIWPGIGLYRIQADRSGKYRGMSKTEYGVTITEKLGDVEVTYPEWCEIVVFKTSPDGSSVDSFPAKLYWKETYVARSSKSVTPNSMWLRRPAAQLEKCVESLALRKAFSDCVGQEPTAEEMEGRVLEHDAPRVKLAYNPETDALEVAKFKDLIAAATSKDELTKIGEILKTTALQPESVKILRGLYKAAVSNFALDTTIIEHVAVNDTPLPVEPQVIAANG